MDISLKYFEEVYTTEHWMVRVYRVLDKRALPRGTSAFVWQHAMCAPRQKASHGIASCSPTHVAHGKSVKPCESPSCLCSRPMHAVKFPWYPAVPGCSLCMHILPPKITCHAVLTLHCTEAWCLLRQAAPGHKAKEPPTDGQGAGQEAAEARGRVRRAGQGLGLGLFLEP